MSGAAGLLYQVVWLRMLIRAFGVTAYATSNVLAVFMGGLALGAWAAGRLASRVRRPLFTYAGVELALAAAAIPVSVAAADLPRLFAAFAPDGPSDSAAVIAVRSLMACGVLLAPTCLMGATLPLLAEFLSRIRRVGVEPRLDPVGLLYGVNTLGAVAGALFAGWYSLGAWGEARSLAFAVALNAAAGLWAGALARTHDAPPAAAPMDSEAALPRDNARSTEAARRKKPQKEDPLAPSAWAGKLPWLMALSGFAALAFEVLWTRMLILVMGTSVYAFSAMLSVYLAGIAAGSVACSRCWLAGQRPPERAFAILQLAAGLLGLLGLNAYVWLGLARSSADYLYSPLLSAWDFPGLFLMAVAVVFPLTFVYGALFPLAARLMDPRGAGKAVGRLYAWNTAGSVLGALCAGFVLIPWLGTRGAVFALCGLHAALGLWTALLPEVRLSLGKPAALGLAALLLMASPVLTQGDPFLKILSNRLGRRAAGKVLFHREGPSSTVTGYASERRETLLLINGITVSGKGPLGEFMSHFPLVLRPAPKRALVICLGAGNTFRAAVDHGVAVDLVELEPEVLASFKDLWPDHAAYLERPGVRVFNNDGRNFVLTSRELYDAVVLDGSPPIYSSGAVNLYSREFVTLAKARLTQDGILALWVPLPCFEGQFWHIARNFTDLFPHTLAWTQPNLEGILLLGSAEPLELSPAELERRVAERGLKARAPWLTADVLAHERLVRDAALRRETARREPVTDDRPRTEFPLPRFLKGERLRRTSEFLQAVR